MSSPHNKQKITAFKKALADFYRQGKRNLPWRRTKNPYYILVSEIMLQQTQTDRVIPKYKEFLRRFPTVNALAKASTADVLKAWQGLGYNRRALALKRAAEKIISDFQGVVPRTLEQLVQLPGVGPYTAAAVCAFAYNQPHNLLETNVRTVLLHHFFPRAVRVADAKLLPLVRATLDRQNPREWYWALMDYGTHLKKTAGNATRRSAAYSKQSPFRNSNRHLRGHILRLLAEKSPQTKRALVQQMTYPASRVAPILTQLAAEKLITIEKQNIWLG